MPVSAQLIIAILTDVRDHEICAFEARRATAPARSDADVSAALARESQIQVALRQAIALGQRDTALAPLKAALARAGISFIEADEDWAALTHHANRVLLEVSEERARREAGHYSTTEPVLKQIATELAVAPAQAAAQTATPVFRSARIALPADAFASAGDAPTVAAGPSVSVLPPVPSVSVQADPARENAPAQIAPVLQAELPPVHPPAPAPASSYPNQLLEPPSSFLGTPAALHATVAAHVAAPATASLPKNINDLRIDVRLLTEQARDVLRDPMNATIDELFGCFKEVKLAGYGDKFHITQKRSDTNTRKFLKNSEASFDVSRRFWVEMLDNCRLAEVHDGMLKTSLELLERVPRLHGKVFPTDEGFRHLIDWADEQDILSEAMSHAKSAEEPCGEAEEMVATGMIDRIRAETIFKHGRAMGRIGRFLEGLGLVPRNPFAICSWTKEEAEERKAIEQSRARIAWDDRIYKLFRTPEFQGEADDPGSVIFWAVMIAIHNGARMQEILQLRTEDFGTEDGHPYLWIRMWRGNEIKTYSGQRKLPIHPNLIELGLLDLVELRRNQGESRLFPDLARGQSKGTHSELVSKMFGYYRKKHDVFTPGMDFHALRTTFYTYLRSARIPDADRRKLMGHAPQDEGERSYSQSLRTFALLPLIETVKVDVSMVKSPIRKADPKIISLAGTRLRQMN